MLSIQKEIQKKWQPRKKTSHKGDFGRVFIVAGSQSYSGAAYLAGFACLRAGAGLVTLGIPETIQAFLARRQPELILKAFPATSEGSLAFKSLSPILKFSKTQDVLALGPGLSQNSQTQKLIREIVRKSDLPLVIDADGLNAFQKNPESLSQGKTRIILTPHPKEFTRLFGGTLTSEEESRKRRGREIAKKIGCVMVLKGHHTVVAHPKGEIYVNQTGNPGMATAGTGDVLTGIIAALLGQKFSLWDSARFAVYLHGLAGDLAARKLGSQSLIASDLIEFLPQALLKTVSA